MSLASSSGRHRSARRSSVDAGHGAVRLPVPEPGRWAAEAYVARHLGHLAERRRPASEAASSPLHRGGQLEAEAVLRRLRLDGYADRARAAYPQPKRAVSSLSPWIRHGLLSLQRVWDSVEGGAPADVRAFRSGLLRQEYARHLYARLGRRLADLGPIPSDTAERSRWDRRLGCVEVPLDELEEDGWLVAEGRWWLASAWTDLLGHDWRLGDDHLHRHALDGSRAAGRASWLTGMGALGEAAAEFSRWDVEEFAPGLCASCEMVRTCPVERPVPAREVPLQDRQPDEDDPSGAAATGTTPVGEVPTGFSSPAERSARRLLAAAPDLTATTGPLMADPVGPIAPEQVWLTAESLGDADPALAAHPDLPAVFVFDQPLLTRLRLSPLRLAFLTETLADLGRRRSLELWLGDPVEVLADRRLAATFTPVPGWRRRAAALEVTVRHPWPWLRLPTDSRIDSFRCWSEAVS
ncbi:MAG: deoxyribodipyrimidine photolyase [Actinomycetota bacterium]